MPESLFSQCERDTEKYRWRRLLQSALILVLLAGLAWPVYQALSAQQRASGDLLTTGRWEKHAYDLVYELAFSSAQQPDGPLVVYRASSADLRAAVPVLAVQRNTGGSVSTKIGRASCRVRV